MSEQLGAVADALRGSDRTVALTGAGVSAGSGIPTFRGRDGVWGREFRPRDFEIARFERDPVGFWKDRERLRERMYPDDPRPNAAHEALVRLERAGYLQAVLTQNTDGLHQAAGSERVVELHGTASRVVCHECGERYDAGPVQERVAAGELPPRCEACDGVLRPDVLLFGEDVPPEAYEEARDLAVGSDVFLALGSSLVVEPAASLPGLAAENGTLVIINRDSTPYSDTADVDVRADLVEALPRVADLLAEE